MQPCSSLDTGALGFNVSTVIKRFNVFADFIFDCFFLFLSPHYVAIDIISIENIETNFSYAALESNLLFHFEYRY